MKNHKVDLMKNHKDPNFYYHVNIYIKYTLIILYVDDIIVIGENNRNIQRI